MLIVLMACSIGNKVKITSFEPEGEVKKLTSFTIEFNKALAPAEVQGKWLDEEFIEFEPKIPCKFRWVSNNTLIVSPMANLEPMQSYKAKVTDKVLFDSEFQSDFNTIEFKTPDFKTEQVELFWTGLPHRNYTVSIQANIVFNYPVNPAELKRNIEVFHQDKQIKDFQILTTESAEIIAVNLGEVKQTEKSQNFRFIIKGELKSVFGKSSLNEDKEFEETLPPLEKLQVIGAVAGFDGSKGWIEVKTTQKVDEERLSEFISLEPQRDMSIFVSDNIIRIECDLTEDRNITVKLKKGLPGLFGGELDDNFEQVVSMVELMPMLRFADLKGKYLMAGGRKNIAVNAVNLNGAEVAVYQVYKNNIANFLANEYYYTDDGEESYYDYYGRNYWVGNNGKELYRKNINFSSSTNWIETFTINLDSVTRAGKQGIYVVEVRSEEDYWLQDSKIIAITDIGLIAKKSANELHVFVNSIASTEPLEGVEVSVISAYNQTLFSGKSDKNGHVVFKDTKEILKEDSPRFITAEKEKDFNYIDLAETRIQTSRFDVAGMNEHSENFSAYIYSDRNLYRPGDKAYISAIVRTERIKNVSDVPVIMKIVSPTGRTFDEFNSMLNEEGSFEVAVALPDFVPTGLYTAYLYTGSEELIGSYKFNVEEFVPDKIRVNLKSSRNSLFTGESLEVYVDAEFLYGEKAAGMRFEANTFFNHAKFDSKKYPEYDFSSFARKNEALPPYIIDGILNENGQATVNYSVPYELWGNEKIIANMFITIFDLTGRPVNRSISFEIYPRRHFIGLKREGYYYGTNQNINIKAVAVDYQDKGIASLPVNVHLVKYEWQSVLRKSYDEKYYYSSEKKEISVWEKDMSISGIKNISFSLNKTGDYELRVAAKGDSAYQKLNFWVYGWATANMTSFEVNKEGNVEILPDKQSYEPGEKAKLLFTAPFSGKMLVSVERNGVYDFEYINVENRSAELILPITDDYMPNVYVSVTLFKKHTPDNSTPLLVGHGFASIKVEKKSNKLPVKIIAPERVKPLTSQTIEIQTASQRDIYVTLAAVDEGILQIKNFKTPDPYSYMYSKRILKTENYDLYKLLLPEIIGSSSPGGGGEGMFDEMSRKLSNPITSKRFNLLAFWSGILRTDGSGKVKVKIDLPQFNGELRLMAVAYSGARFGSAEKPMKVVDDIIIEPEIPRVLSINDILTAPVTLINTTNKAAKVKVAMKLEGNLQAWSESNFDISIPPNSNRQIVYKIKAKEAAGIGKITFETSGSIKVKNTTDISIRPISPYITETGSGTIAAGKTQSIKLPGGFLQGTEERTLTISKFPAVKYARQLKYLIAYPHGCVEQTISRLFPQLYFADLSRAVAPEKFKANSPDKYINDGIKKLESMQIYNGALAYWEGGNNESWWGSVYAAHFLLEAKKAGYQVNGEFLRRLLNYIDKKSKSKSEYDYIRYENGSARNIRVVNKEIPYSLYVLAMAGRADYSTMNYYKARPNVLSNDSKYLLAGAFALAGRWSSYHSFIPAKFAPEKTVRTGSGSFDSEIRANAIMLSVLIDTDPSNPQINSIVRHLSGLVKDCFSTQENAWAFLSLGKAAKRIGNSKVKIDVVIAGKTIKTFENKDIVLTSDEIKSDDIQLKSSGSGEVYYFWSVKGVKTTSKVPETDSYISVRRNYFDFRTGQQLNGNYVQGQLILCKITLTSSQRSAQNLIITDIIPSGFEIENPRLSAMTESAVKDNTLNIEYMDVKDDRMLLFTSIEAGSTRQFSYLIRVVNQGEMVLPVISAEAMYEPEIYSRNGAGIVRVSPYKKASI